MVRRLVHLHEQTCLLAHASPCTRAADHTISLLIWGFTSGVDLSRRFFELAVFYARLYIRVRRLDEPAERCGVCGRSRSQLHMAHELAGALQQAPDPAALRRERTPRLH